MGLFDLLAKKLTKKSKKTESNQFVLSGDWLVDFVESNIENPTQENVLKAIDKLATPSEDLEHLTEDGKLPWGWHTHTKDFTGKVKNEFSYFLDLWLESRNKSPREQYLALNSFVTYLEDAERYCKAKDECYEFWFYGCVASEEYIEKRKKELEELTANFDELQADFKKRSVLLSDLDIRIVKMLTENPGILQSDFLKMFDPLIQNDVKGKLYFMAKSGELERTKSGRSYILYYKN